jgi:hypothetical protein
MIQRVLMAVINYDHPQRGMEHSMKVLFGAENVFNFDYCDLRRNGLSIEAINQHFVGAAVEAKADWIWLQVQDTQVLMPESVLRLKAALPRAAVTHWTGDLRESVSPYLASFCQVCDLTLISSIGQIPIFRAAGARKVSYCQIGLDWEEDVLGARPLSNELRKVDVVFCGNYYGDRFPGTKDRLASVLALQNHGIDVGVVGIGWPSGIPVLGRCHVKEQFHVYQKAKVALSVNNFNDIERYYSDRQLIAMASGIPVVCRYIPGLEHEFVNERELLWYSNTSELASHVRRLLSSDSLRRSMGQNGRRAVIRNHTWLSRFLDILPQVEEIRAERLCPEGDREIAPSATTDSISINST